MMHKDLLLGIDVGTTGTKCSVYDFHGKRVASAYREYPMIHPQARMDRTGPFPVVGRGVLQPADHISKPGHR